MPEATIHEDYNSPARKNNVWGSWKIFAMEPVSVATCKQGLANPHLWLCVLATNARHHLAALFCWNDVSHCSTCSRREQKSCLYSS